MGLEALKRSAIGLAVAAASLAVAPAQAGVVTVDVGGIDSNDAIGDAINEVRMVDVGSWHQVVKVSWEVELFADNPSWLSEMLVDLMGHNGNGGVLQVAPGSNLSGTQAFAGSIDLLALGESFGVGANGLLRMEFFEKFDDFTDEWDGIWLAGNITIETVPEPASYGLMGVALLGAAFASRRRSRDRRPAA